jgi:hypothetical protein
LLTVFPTFPIFTEVPLSPQGAGIRSKEEANRHDYDDDATNYCSCDPPPGLNRKGTATPGSGTQTRSRRDYLATPLHHLTTRMTSFRAVTFPGAEWRPAPGAEGTGTGRERPTTRNLSHAVASEVPHQP